jgi:hypothetical protein
VTEKSERVEAEAKAAEDHKNEKKGRAGFHTHRYVELEVL